MKDLKAILEASILADIEDTLSVNKNDLSKKFNVNVPFKSFEDAIIAFELLLNQDVKYVKSDGTISVTNRIYKDTVYSDKFKFGSKNDKIGVFTINKLYKFIIIGNKKFDNIKNTILEIRDSKSFLRFQIKFENDKNEIFYCRYFDYLKEDDLPISTAIYNVSSFADNPSADALKVIINSYTK